MTFKAVLFDMGNTLVDSRTTEETFAKILAEKGYHVSIDDVRKVIRRYIDENAIKGDLEHYHGNSAEDFYIAYNDAIIKHLAIPNPEPGLGKYVYDRWFEVLHLFLLPNAESTINTLKEKGIKVGIVTNGFRDEVEIVFDGLAIQPDDFDIVVGCNTTGFAKPNPLPFEHAAKLLAIPIDEIIFVGDSYTNDYLGSKNVGMFPLLYLPGDGQPPNSEVRYIRNLAEILDYI